MGFHLFLCSSLACVGRQLATTAGCGCFFTLVYLGLFRLSTFVLVYFGVPPMCSQRKWPSVSENDLTSLLACGVPRLPPSSLLPLYPLFFIFFLLHHLQWRVSAHACGFLFVRGVSVLHQCGEGERRRSGGFLFQRWRAVAPAALQRRAPWGPFLQFASGAMDRQCTGRSV